MAILYSPNSYEHGDITSGILVLYSLLLYLHDVRKLIITFPFHNIFYF